MALVTDKLIKELLSNFRRDFERAFLATGEKDVFSQFVSEIPSSTDANTYNWLSLWPEFQEWIKASARAPKDIKAFAHKITNKKYESTVEIPAEDIEDDNIGYLRGLPQSYVDSFLRWRMGELAKLLKNGFSSNCYDGKKFFAKDHPLYPNRDGSGTAKKQENIVGNNSATGAAWYLLDLSKPLKPFLYQNRRGLRVVMRNDPRTSDAMFTKDIVQWGIDFRGVCEYTLYHLATASKEDLSQTNYETARKTLREMKRDGEEPMDIEPTHLVVPPSLEASAKTLIEAQTLASGASNPNYNDVKVVVMNRLA